MPRKRERALHPAVERAHRARSRVRASRKPRDGLLKHTIIMTKVAQLSCKMELAVAAANSDHTLRINKPYSALLVVRLSPMFELGGYHPLVQDAPEFGQVVFTVSTIENYFGIFFFHRTCVGNNRNRNRGP